MCVFTLLLFEPAFCWRQRVLRRSRAELILCSRVLPRLDIVLSPRRKNYDFVWPRHSIAGGIRGGRCDAVPLVSIMLMLMRIVLF